MGAKPRLPGAPHHVGSSPPRSAGVRGRAFVGECPKQSHALDRVPLSAGSLQLLAQEVGRLPLVRHELLDALPHPALAPCDLASDLFCGRGLAPAALALAPQPRVLAAAFAPCTPPPAVYPQPLFFLPPPPRLS